MGIISSKDTRRVSFNNTSAIEESNIPKTIEENKLICLDTLAEDANDDLIVNEDKVEVLAKENGYGDYWSHRIEELRKNHQTINKIIEKEYEKTFEYVNNNIESPKETRETFQKISPCLKWRTKIVHCYESNPRQSLVCSDMVQAFSRCIAACRMEN